MQKEYTPFLLIIILFTTGLILTDFSNAQTEDIDILKHNQVVDKATRESEKSKKQSALASTSNILNLVKDNNSDHCYQYNATYYATNKNVPSLYVVISRQMSDKITFSY